MAPYVAYAGEIYRSGRPPALPTDPDGLEEAARAVLPPEAFWYAAGGAGSGATMRANRAAFDRHRFVPRMLRDNTMRDLVDERARHRDARPAAARPDRRAVDPAPRRRARLGPRRGRARAADGGLDRVVAHARGGRRGQRRRPALVPALLAQRRRRHGQPPAPGPRRRVHGARRHARHLAARLAPARPRRAPTCRSCAASAPRSRSPTPRSGPALPAPPEEDLAAAVAYRQKIFHGTAQGWSALPFLRRAWDGPIVLKGIQHPDDARAALDAGMDGVIVSNHGGRQADRAIGSLTALPAVVDGRRRPARRCSSTPASAPAPTPAQALALGADAVLLGRPSSTASRTTARPGCATCSAACWRSWTPPWPSRATRRSPSSAPSSRTLTC